MIEHTGKLRGVASQRPGEAAIQSPELLHITGSGRRYYGACQVWYPSWMQRMSGCGPTAASNLLWYIAATRPHLCGIIFDGDGTNRRDMIRLMNNVWEYVKPGMRGVDKPSILSGGGIRYGAERGVALAARTLEVPSRPANRPDGSAVWAFLAGAFADDLPIAFLNLSNGEVRGLESWHWVTLVSVDEGLRARMYDQGYNSLIDLDLWLRTTRGGGAFVALEPA